LLADNRSRQTILSRGTPPLQPPSVLSGTYTTFDFSPHPRQKSRFEKDGSFLLEIPYADSRELVMDILRHGADVEVLSPAALRREVVAALHAAAARYQ
jgi:predicted DNA-binding transcriptional regulator YafY